MTVAYTVVFAAAVVVMVVGVGVRSVKELRRSRRVGPDVYFLEPGPPRPRILVAVSFAAVGVTASLMASGTTIILDEVASHATTLGWGAAAASYLFSLISGAPVDRCGPLVTLVPFGAGLLGGLCGLML